jgi:hypothetical protein
MKTIQITKKFISGPLMGISVTEEDTPDIPASAKRGSKLIDYITETPFIITNIVIAESNDLSVKE